MQDATHASADTGSFRDPSGVVFYRAGEVFRQVNTTYQKQYDALMSSGLYDELSCKGLIVSHKEVCEDGIDKQAYKVIQPQRIPFISYAYEWSFSQLKDAALTTLLIHRMALEHDMILKDASVYNIQFQRGKPIHIDTLSFDFYTEGDPWVAYGQFCRHFLAPLFLMSYTDQRLLQLMRVYIDGIPLDLASSLLGNKGGLAAKSHIHWHAKSVTRHGEAGKSEIASTKQLKISKFKMTAMIDSLIKVIKKLELKSEQTEWGSYTDRTSYSESGAESKKRIIAEYLEIVKPKISWDLGGNDGTYSRLALNNSDDFVVVFDIDPHAVERNYRVVRRTGENLLPLLIDLVNPSPAMGFAGTERGTISERQKPDCIMMLAVVHHLAISNNLPLGIIAQWLSALTDNLIIEFVPKTDPQVRVLLATRDDVFPDYTERGFEESFSRYFDIVLKHELDECNRTMYLMNKPNK